jgi:hypothetical protein
VQASYKGICSSVRLFVGALEKLPPPQVLLLSIHPLQAYIQTSCLWKGRHLFCQASFLPIWGHLSSAPYINLKVCIKDSSLSPSCSYVLNLVHILCSYSSRKTTFVYYEDYIVLIWCNISVFEVVSCKPRGVFRSCSSLGAEDFK